MLQWPHSLTYCPALAMDKRIAKCITRLINRLEGCRASIEINTDQEIILKDLKTHATLSKVTQEQLSLMASHGLISYEGQNITLTMAAKSFCARQTSSDHCFADQHRTNDQIQINQGEQTTTLTRNIEESPLLSLYRRKTKTGAPFLSDAEFHAGERLRRDFTFGALMPSVTMRWGESASAKQTGHPTEMSDETLAARQRVNKALKAVGTDLGTVLIDVCCFLKGMETLEKERQWPVRSAKVVLKTALIALDRYYNPENRPLPPQYKHIHAMEMHTY